MQLWLLAIKSPKSDIQNCQCYDRSLITNDRVKQRMLCRTLFWGENECFFKSETKKLRKLSKKIAKKNGDIRKWECKIFMAFQNTPCQSAACGFRLLTSSILFLAILTLLGHQGKGLVWGRDWDSIQSYLWA